MAELFKAILDLAPPVLTLAAIAGLGYKVGEFHTHFLLRRTTDKEVDDANVLLSAARRTADASREDAQKWKSKFEELGPTAGDRGAVEKLDKVRGLVDKSGSIWFETPLAPPPIRPISTGGRAVLTIANLKGGVGKTTISTHLAAALGRHKKVLFVDLDFQGSGSTFLLRDAKREDLVELGDRSKAGRFLGPSSDLRALSSLPISLGPRTPGVSVVPAYYPLADTEERLMLRWIIGDEPEDIRFNLRNTLHADIFDWDIVIIDGPPRLSTAMAEAIAASTHIIIPTQIERKSTEAALSFVETLQSMRENGVNPQLNILGILPSMVPPEREIRGEEMKYLRDVVAPKIGGPDPLWNDTRIPQRTAFNGPNLVSRGRDPGANAASAAIDALAIKVLGRVWHAP